MKNILFYLLPWAILSGCQPPATKPVHYQIRSESDSFYMANAFPIDRSPWFGDSAIVMPAPQSYDTVYWYRGSGGWGAFDDLCAIYSQNKKWYLGWIHLTKPYSRKYDKTSIPVQPEQLKQFRYLLDSLNTRCLPCQIDTIGSPEGQMGYNTDVPRYDFFIKEGGAFWYMHWGSRCYPCEHSKIKAVHEMRTLAAFMLTTAGYPPPQLFYILEKAAGGYKAQYFLPDLHLVRSVKIVLGDSILPEREGISVLKVSKSNDPDIERTRAHVELLDGTRLILAPERYKK